MDKYDEKAEKIYYGTLTRDFIAQALRESAAEAKETERQRILNASFDLELIEGATFLGNEEEMSGLDLEDMMIVPASALHAPVQGGK